MNKLSALLICISILSCQSEVTNKESTTIEEKNLLTTTETAVTSKADTLLNNNDYLILGQQGGKVKIVKEQSLKDYPTYETLIGYRDDIIIGEQLVYDSVQMYRKYNPKTTFKDYQVEVYEGVLAEPDFSTDPDAKRFITRIKNGCNDGINFAGHYTLVTWGCGSPCQSGVVVDRKTGVIHGGYGTALGAKYQIDSKLLIRNIGAIDTTTNLIRLCAYCDVNHEIWTGTEFETVE